MNKIGRTILATCLIAIGTIVCTSCQRHEAPTSDHPGDAPRVNRVDQNTIQSPRREERSPGSDTTTSHPLVPVRSVATVQDQAIAQELQHQDPSVDQWDTEAISDRISQNLKKLARLIQRGSLDNAALSAYIDPQFTCPALLPAEMKTTFRDALFDVARGKQESSSSFRGAVGFAESVERLQQDLNATSLDFHFKITRVTQQEGQAETMLFVEISASGETPVSLVSRWTCRWTDLESPKLLSIRIDDCEKVTAATKLFVDATTLALGGTESFQEHLLFGMDHWRDRLDWRFGLEIAGPHGLAVADVNGDGLDDLFFCETGGLPNRLYLQNSDGSVTDASETSGLDYLEPTHSALFADLDNDGDQDAVLASGRFVLISENDGTGRFVRRIIHQTESMLRSIAAADYDMDGDLDFYVCGYFPRDAIGEGVGLGRPMPYHDANNGVPNYLFANNGEFQFVDVTDSVGLNQNNRRFSYAAAWEDFDNDGDQDLYVANDFGRNNLYRNDGDRFVDIAAEAGVEDMSAGMSVSWGDFDRDGLFDLYVGNMFSSAGNRITYQRRFQSDRDPTVRELFQRHARGNTLFRNLGDGTFQDVSVEANVTMGRWSWGSNFADINNDGGEDILIGNGMVTSFHDPGDL